MDDSLEIKRIDREIVVFLVAEKLTVLAKEAALGVVDSMKTGHYTTPDTIRWARNIIAIVKEHSV